MGNAVRNQNYETRFQNISGTTKILATDGDTTLVTNPNANYSIFIKSLRVVVTTDGARTWSFEDSNATPKVIATMPASPGLGSQEWEWPGEGVQLTEGKNFVLNVSAADIAATVYWQGYQRPTALSRTAANL